MTPYRHETMGEVVEEIVRSHMGSGVVKTVQTLTDNDDVIDVILELDQDLGEEGRSRLFSLARVLRGHLISLHDDRFPVISTRRIANA